MLRWFKDNHQTMTGLGAMLVGVAALYVAWDQARVMRAQQHGAVVPVIQIDGFVNTTDDTASIGVRLANNGVGPALIRDVSLIRDGIEQTNVSELLAGIPEGYDLSWSALAGRAVAPGEEVTPVRMSWSTSDVDPDILRAVAMEWDNWELEICYCSVFDRCWISSPAGGAAAIPVPQCEVSGLDLFTHLGEAPFNEEIE